MIEVHWVTHDIDNHHGTFNTTEEAQKSVQNWWKSHDFKPPYIRQWEKNGIITWDYGNHSSFYEFRKVDE